MAGVLELGSVDAPERLLELDWQGPGEIMVWVHGLKGMLFQVVYVLVVLFVVGDQVSEVGKDLGLAEMELEVVEEHVERADGFEGVVRGSLLAVVVLVEGGLGLVNLN